MSEQRCDVTATVTSRLGLHARPAARFAAAVQRSGLPVTLTSEGRQVNAASVLGVLSLAIEHGARVTLTAEGPTAPAILSRLAELLSTELDEVMDASNHLE